MEFREWTVTVTLHNGTEEQWTVGGFLSELEAVAVRDGCLWLYYCDSQFSANRQHVTSYPLDSYRRWNISRKTR